MDTLYVRILFGPHFPPSKLHYILVIIFLRFSLNLELALPQITVLQNVLNPILNMFPFFFKYRIRKLDLSLPRLQTQSPLSAPPFRKSHLQHLHAPPHQNSYPFSFCRVNYVNNTNKPDLRRAGAPNQLNSTPVPHGLRES